MPKPRLYYPDTLKPDQTLSLDKNTSHHLIRVMRTKKKSDLILFNGDGFEYSAILLDENPKSCTLTVNKKNQVQTESPIQITLLQGISRSDRMDTCIQKSTELGIISIIPVICDKSTVKLNTDKNQKKITHWEKIIISACEQSGRCVIPDLQPIISYQTALHSISASCKLVLSPLSATGLRNLKKPEGDITILIGPEGGLTQDETQLAINAGFEAIQMGPRILRTETAAPACIAAIQTLWGDLGGRV